MLRAFKGLTPIQLLSCGFDSSVGRALQGDRKGHAFESRSEPENFFQVSSVVLDRIRAHHGIYLYMLLLDKYLFIH